MKNNPKEAKAVIGIIGIIIILGSILFGIMVGSKYLSKMLTPNFSSPIQEDVEWRTYPSHNGFDLEVSDKTPVYAVGDGKVETVAENMPRPNSMTHGNESLGNYVLVKHKHGYTSVCARMDEVVVKENQKVKQGDLIGYVGGEKSNSFLHYEVRHKDKPFKFVGIQSCKPQGHDSDKKEA